MDLAENPKTIWLKITAVQSIAVIIVAIAVGIMAGFKTGSIIALGGVTVILPTALFAHIFFRNMLFRKPVSIVIVLYVCEGLKILLSASLLILLFKFTSVRLVPLVCGYIAAYLSGLLIPMILIARK